MAQEKRIGDILRDIKYIKDKETICRKVSSVLEADDDLATRLKEATEASSYDFNGAANWLCEYASIMSQAVDNTSIPWPPQT